MTDNNTESDSEKSPETVKAYPSKDTYEAVGADVDAKTGAGEFVDNAIDNSGLISNHADPITVEFRHQTLDDGTEELLIRDNSGGIIAEELGIVIGLGQSKKSGAMRQQVGAFGIGAKKALKAFGNDFNIASRHHRAEQGYQYHVPAEWFDDDEVWEFDLEEADLDEGVTELRVRELNIDWENQVEDIKQWLRDTYQQYMGVGPSDVKLDLTLKVDGETLSAPDPVPWAYSPWDGLHPRRHSGFEFYSRELNAPVKMQVTVGIMRSGNGKEAGTDIFCQDRLVEKANREKAGGYGVTDGLPKFELHQYRRLKIQIEFWSTENGTAKDLPWNSDKSRIRPSHPVMTQAYEWIRKVAKRYMKAAQYGVKGIDEAFLKHYDKDSEHSVDIERVDFEARWKKHQDGKDIRVTDKPKRGFPSVNKMEATAEAHAKLGISCENVAWFEDWMLPTYNDLVNDEFANLSDDDFGSLTDEGVTLPTLKNVSTAPPDFTSGGRQADSEVERLISMARQHVEDGVQYTGVDEWERPWYNSALKAFTDEADIEPKDLEEIDDFSNIEDDESATEDADNEGSDIEDDESETDNVDHKSTDTGPVTTDGPATDQTEEATNGSSSSTQAGFSGNRAGDSSGTSQKSAAEPSSIGEGAQSEEEADAADDALVFSGWTQEELELVTKHFEDLEAISPEERKQVLVNLAKALESGQLKYNVLGD